MKTFSFFSFLLICSIFGQLDARTCYECYDRVHCQSPSTIICPSDDYGCATAVIDIEPFVTKGCLTDDKGPLKLNGCKGKTKNGVTGKLCGCMGEDLCNTESLDTIQAMNYSVEADPDSDTSIETSTEGGKKKGKGKNRKNKENESAPLYETNKDLALTEITPSTSTTSTQTQKSTTPTSTKPSEPTTTTPSSASSKSSPHTTTEPFGDDEKMSANMLPDPNQGGTMSATEAPKSNVEKSENYFLAFLLIPASWVLCFAVMK